MYQSRSVQLEAELEQLEKEMKAARKVIQGMEESEAGFKSRGWNHLEGEG